MKSYLLGTANPEERSAFENKYLSDPVLFETLVEAENDLIDAYARHQLSEADLLQFERCYLGSPRGRARVQFASALTDLSREPQEAATAEISLWNRLLSSFSEDRGLRLSLAGLVATFLIIVSLKLVNYRPGGTTNQAGPTSSGAPIAEQHVEVARSNPPELDQLTVKLSPGVARSTASKEQVVVLPTQATLVTFRLLLEEDSHPTYSAVLETAEGKHIQSSDQLRSHSLDGSNVVEMSVRSNLMPRGDYVIHLNGTMQTKTEDRDVEAYTFRAVYK